MIIAVTLDISRYYKTVAYSLRVPYTPYEFSSRVA